MQSIDEITPSAWMDESGHVISAKQLHNGPSPLYPIALYTAIDLDKVRRETWEAALKIVDKIITCGCADEEIYRAKEALRASAAAKGGQT